MARVKPLARADLDVVEIDGEAVVYDRSYPKVNHLNHTAALVLGLCDGKTTIFEMVEGIADVYEMPEDEVEQQVRKLIRDLRAINLIERRDAPAHESGRHDQPRDARRRVRMQVPKST